MKKTVNNQEVPAVEVPAVEAPKVSRNKGIGKFVMDLMLDKKTADWTNQEILDAVLVKFESKTTYACIAWYRTHLRSLGKVAPRTTKKVEEAVAA